MTKDEEIAALKAAFDEFSLSSAVLVDSYDELQKQAKVLSERLAIAEQAKAREEKKNQLLLSQFKQLFESMPVGVLLLNDEGVIIMANSAANGLFSFSLLGESWSKVVTQSFSPQQDDGHEITMVSGRRVRVETSSLGNVPGQLVIFVDLTETHKLQKQLAHHERLSTMGTMVAALAHQIRTPLSTATLYADHLQKEHLGLEHRLKFSAKLMGRLQHMERQIRDMLVFSKSDIHLDEKLDLESFLTEFKLTSDEVCGQKQTQLEFFVSSPVAEYLLQCNKDTLIGALVNLINNGIEAQGEGGIIQIKCEIQNGSLDIYCIDFGEGMSPEMLERIQQGFMTTKQNGTGLGIMVVKAISRAHHGHFELHSEQGQGTTALVRLPLIKV
ncbi:sensor histidine kinase [Marinomonas sp. 2405UD68-3]|uniref:sensor histidine kinase n=1 Tax=Marinomonas sp. 2405UD68-3 TaxID=3391835 RepID=UPI0039C94410